MSLFRLEQMENGMNKDYEVGPVLSISILSSGRKNTIGRCLASIDPLKEKVSTELVIVDTSDKSDPDVRGILERYADKVIDFTWCDDFSKARNVGLAECTGQWFMFIDDDEWFGDASDLADFLNSSESERYSWASFGICNYTNEERTQYGDSRVGRLAKMVPGLSFKGKIHEYLDPLDGEPKYFGTFLYHTGYIYKSTQERYAHAMRNLPLLEETAKEDPYNMRWQYQLLMEYSTLEQPDNMRRVCDYALNYYEDVNRSFGEERFYGMFAAARLWVERKYSDWEQGKKVYERVSKIDNIPDIAKAHIALDGSQVYYRLDDNDKSRQLCAKYLDLLDSRNPKEDFKDAEYFLLETFETYMYSLVMSMIIHFDVTNGKWETFDKYFERIDDPQYLGTVVDTILKFDDFGMAMEHVEASRLPIWRSGIDSYLSDKSHPKKGELIEILNRLGQRASGGITSAYSEYAGSRIGGWLLVNILDKNDGTEIDLRKTLQRFANDCLAYYRRGVRAELIDENSGLLEDDLRLAIKLDGIFSLDAADWRGVLNGLKEAIGTYPEADDAIGIYSHQYADSLKARQEEERKAQQQAIAGSAGEMRQLLVALHNKVQTLIDAGMIDEAQMVMDEIKKYDKLFG